MKLCRIEFPNTEFSVIEVPEQAALTEYLTPENSPVLFGCCNGVCATCLVEVETVQGKIETPTEEELDTLEIYAEGNPKARLACQIRLSADLKMKKIYPL